MDGAKDAGLITSVRFFRLFQLVHTGKPSKRQHANSSNSNISSNIGAFFVSERCREVNYQRSHAAFDGLEEQRHLEEEDDEDAMLDIDDGESIEDMTVFSLPDEWYVLPTANSTLFRCS